LTVVEDLEEPVRPKVLLAACAAGVAALAAPLPAGAQTLNMETLTAEQTTMLVVDCQPAGTSTVTYTVTGTAGGPYPGTFEETGTYTVAGGQLQSFEAEFTIASGTTTVEGTKTLRTAVTGTCAPATGLLALSDVALDADYEATITPASGPAASDSGRAAIAGQFIVPESGGPAGSLSEAFFSEALVQTPGHVTGGGLVEDPLHGWVVFGFVAKSDGASPSAKCAVLAPGTLVKCVDASFFAQTPTYATFLGEARLNGDEVAYRIDVDDLGEPGRGVDTFSVEAGAFSAAGVLEAGNVQIHE
jgi:hypothetical protein